MGIVLRWLERLLEVPCLRDYPLRRSSARLWPGAGACRQPPLGGAALFRISELRQRRLFC
jgi:hypothetical protein